MCELDVVLIGSGNMAVEHTKVLQNLGKKFSVVGRGSESAARYYHKTGIEVKSGGLDNWLKTEDIHCNQAIVAVSGTELGKVIRALLQNGYDNILVEKPGGFDYQDLFATYELSNKLNANIHIAYNRRFYESVSKVKNIVSEDGGVKSFFFEFTEWSHAIKKSDVNKKILEKWFIHNSTHVIDLAFYLGGEPVDMCSFVGNKEDWHPDGMIFSGSGKSNRGALFSYQANWNSPGNWSVEILSDNYRLLLNPLEKVFIRNIGENRYSEVSIPEEKYKPGFLKQDLMWLNQDFSEMLSLKMQIERFKWYYKMLNKEIM